jgi:hypothetical protein
LDFSQGKWARILLHWATMTSWEIIFLRKIQEFLANHDPLSNSNQRSLFTCPIN